MSIDNVTHLVTFAHGLLDRLRENLHNDPQVVDDWRNDLNMFEDRHLPRYANTEVVLRDLDAQIVKLEAELQIARTDLGTQPGSFLWALRQGRPMRRLAMLKHPPTGDEAEAAEFRRLMDHWWWYPVVQLPADAVHITVWQNLANGRRNTMTRYDYLATDWEVMP